MGCSNCGGALAMTDSEGGVAEGSFTEFYECGECGGTGTITGEASDPPTEWTHTGVAV